MKKVDLVNGNILKVLIYLAFPIMATSFLQMAYNLVDMLWIGRIGSDAVASVGTAGFYMWLSFAFIRLIQVGTEVNVSQSLGAEKYKDANSYSNSAIQLAVIIAIMYGAVIFIFSKQLIEFFDLGNIAVEMEALKYLRVVTLGMIFAFLNPVISCIYNGSGDSKTPFKINSIGLLINIVLDPLFIFTLKFGVVGAAYATVLSQFIVTILLAYLIISGNKPFDDFKFKIRLNIKSSLKVLKMGLPVAAQSGLFTIFGILIAKVIASYGPSAIAAQKVGVQIESISYMTANGFAAALSTYTGQNFGAGNMNRVKKGIISAFWIMSTFGIITSVLLYVFAEPIFMIFISDTKALGIGVNYLQIIALSQVFMCVEITLSGAFNGLGKTLPPALMSIIFTGARVPLAYILGREAVLGLSGIWWTISISSVFKGLFAVIMIIILIKRTQNSIKSQMSS
ncbi:MAG: MATE family efflux transporter [Acidaminobacteraceae bacterium]